MSERFGDIMDKRPIGVFDSGLGGLTFVKELKTIMPNEDIVFFGDTGRVPYGTRSRDTIELYARQDAQFLLSKDVKFIVAACGTVSSVAPNTAIGLPVPFLGVVEPTAAAAVNATKNHKIAVLGTPATINSGAYNKSLLALDKSLTVTCVKCPLFVPLVEEGLINRDEEITILAAKMYLEPIIESGADTVILGCTHYPLIAPIIADNLGDSVTLISAGGATAHECKRIILENGLENDSTANGRYSYFVTDSPSSFEKTAKLFLQEEVGTAVSRVYVG